jgi:hypothetical protein
MSVNQSALLEDKAAIKRWMIDGKSDDIQTSYSHAAWFLILTQTSHIYPGKGYLFLLLVRRIQRPSTPPHRPPYASSKAQCPNTVTPPSSTVHPSSARPHPPPRVLRSPTKPSTPPGLGQGRCCLSSRSRGSSSCATPMCRRRARLRCSGGRVNRALKGHEEVVFSRAKGQMARGISHW